MVGLSRGSGIPTRYEGTMAAAAVLSALMYSCVCARGVRESSHRKICVPLKSAHS